MNGTAIVVMRGTKTSLSVRVEMEGPKLNTVKSTGIEVALSVGVNTLRDRESSEVGNGIKSEAVLAGVSTSLDATVKIIFVVSTVSGIIVLVRGKKTIGVLSIPLLKSTALVAIENIEVDVLSVGEGVGVVMATTDGVEKLAKCVSGVDTKLDKLVCMTEEVSMVENCEGVSILLLRMGALDNTVAVVKLKP